MLIHHHIKEAWPLSERESERGWHGCVCQSLYRWRHIVPIWPYSDPIYSHFSPIKWQEWAFFLRHTASFDFPPLSLNDCTCQPDYDFTMEGNRETSKRHWFWEGGRVNIKVPSHSPFTPHPKSIISRGRPSQGLTLPSPLWPYHWLQTSLSRGAMIANRKQTPSQSGRQTLPSMSFPLVMTAMSHSSFSQLCYLIDKNITKT